MIASCSARSPQLKRDSLGSAIMTPKKPTEYPKDAYQELGGVVKPGYYIRFDDPSKVPSALTKVGAFASPASYRTTVVMGSGTSQHPPSIGSIAPAPGTTIYRVTAIRFDRHKDGEAHFNKDDVLIFKDGADRTWQLYARDQPGHYKKLSIDSGLAAAIDVYRWPSATSGALTDIQKSGGLVDFSTGSKKV